MPSPNVSLSCASSARLAPGVSALHMLRSLLQVEDVKLTEQQIQFGEVVFPEHLVSPLCRSFIQQVGAPAGSAVARPQVRQCVTSHK